MKSKIEENEKKKKNPPHYSNTHTISRSTQNHISADEYKPIYSVSEEKIEL